MTDLQELRRLLGLGILRMEPNGDIVAIETAKVRTQVPTKVANLRDLLDELEPPVVTVSADTVRFGPTKVIASDPEINWKPGETKRMVGNTLVYRSYEDYCSD